MCANLWLPRMESTGGAPCTPTRCGSNVFPDQLSLVNEILNVIVSWSYMMTPSSKAAYMLEVCATIDGAAAVGSIGPSGGGATPT